MTQTRWCTGPGILVAPCLARSTEHNRIVSNLVMGCRNTGTRAVSEVQYQMAPSNNLTLTSPGNRPSRNAHRSTRKCSSSIGTIKKYEKILHSGKLQIVATKWFVDTPYGRQILNTDIVIRTNLTPSPLSASLPD